MVGEAMYRKRFNPVLTLEQLLAATTALPVLASEEEAFYWLCNNEDLVTWENAVSLLRMIHKSYQHLMRDLKSVEDFFFAGMAVPP